MPSYRLLRSNKESGPYSLNDLVALGLKPYDLVWVDGRSAAWRYPSEVAELKEFAPAVEEQPYDRFYKKSSETEAPVKEFTPAPREEMAPQKNFIKEHVEKKEPVLKEEPVKKIIPEIQTPSYQPNPTQPRKQVFVSMPEKNGFDQGVNQYQQEQYHQYLPKPKPTEQKPIPVQEKSYSPIDIHEPDESKLETKYTQSLDDIKEMYINTLVQRKTKNRRKEIIKKYIKPALVPLFLLFSGVAIGFVITNKKNSSKAVQAVSTVVPPQTVPEQKNEQPEVDDKILQPENKQDLGLKTDHKNQKPSGRTQVLIQTQDSKKSTAAVPKAVVPAKKEKETFIPDDEIATAQKRNVEVDPTTGERTRVVRDNDEIVTEETTNRNNNAGKLNKKNNTERAFLETGHKTIWDFVSVKSNNYIRGAFGGIRGLEITVYNTSGFMLDEVSVELQIMKPSEQPLRTDIITFRNISARGTVTVRVPDSQRGIRVDYRITNIESKQWQKNTAGL